MISIFRKKNKYIFSPAYFFIFIIIIFCSCSSNKNLSESQKIKNRILAEEKRNNKRSNNNFLAYHNSYYLAKTKFQDAFDLMNKEENSHNQSLSSFTLFDDAIKYASIVINDFQNTIFFEDAAYIIARSSYYKNLLSPSTFYFKAILDNKVSPYYFDSLVRLGFINLRLGNKNDLMKIMEELEYNVKDFDRNIDNLKKKIPYKFLENELLNTTSNYFLLKAEISKSMDRDHLLIEENYLRAIETATTNNHKKDIYSQLILFFETLNDKDKVLKYINKLKDEFDIDEDSDDLMINWYDYNRKLGFFEDIHDYLDNKLLNDLSTDKEIYYSIEKAKTYVEQNNFIEAENIYNNILIKYETAMNSYKNYFADIYFQLGQIYMKEYHQYDKALDYFNLSLEKKPTDLNVKSSFQSLEKYIEMLNQYLILTNSIPNDTTVITNEYTKENEETNPFMIPLPSNYEYEVSNTDTLLFDMSSILYFELELKDEALEKLNMIVSDDATSPLMPKVILFLKEISPLNNWDSLYTAEDSKLFFKQKNNVLDLEVEENRKKAFIEMEQSIYDALDLFKNNYSEHADLASLYMIGLIYDEYLNDIDNAVKYYNEYIEYDIAVNYVQISNRLNEIKSIIENEISLVEQSMSYYNGLLYIENSSDLSNSDSIIIDLEKYKQGTQANINKKCNDLLSILKFPLYTELKDTLLKNNNFHVSNKSRGKKSMDNLIIDVASFIHRRTSNHQLAAEYYKIIVDYYKNTELYVDASLALNQIEPDGNWLSLFLESKDEEFLNIERFNPRTGEEVVNATKNRLFPEVFEAENVIYSVPFDSLNDSPINFDDLVPNSIYNIQMKDNFLSYDSNIKGKMAILYDKGIQYFISDEKIFFNNNSMVAINPEYEKNIEIPIYSYFFNQDFLFAAHEIFESIDGIGYRYNINNSQSECSYLGDDFSCYEIGFIPSNNGNSKTVWILEIEDNVFIKIKEYEFDNNGNLLLEKNIEYIKIDLYYVINKIRENNFNNNTTTLLARNNIKVDNGIFFIANAPEMKVQSSSSYNNFFYTKSLSEYDNIDQLNNELSRLNAMYDKLFPKEIEEESNKDKSFDYIQSVNQYFYFVEDASIGGVELTNDDWLVSYNDNVIVGARKYALGGNIDIPIMGYDNSSENTKIATVGYCKNGDLPIIKVHRFDGQIIEMDVIKIDGDLEFKGIGHATIVLKKD